MPFSARDRPPAGSPTDVGPSARLWRYGGAIVVLTLAALGWWGWGQWQQSRDEQLRILCPNVFAESVRQVARQYQQQFGFGIRVEEAEPAALLADLVAQPDRADLLVFNDAANLRNARQQKLVDEQLPLLEYHPVLIVPKGNPKGVAAVRDLLQSELQVSLVDPDRGQLGQVVMQMLDKDAQWQQMQLQSRLKGNRVSLKGTVERVMAAVRAGESDAGIVWDYNAREHAAEFDAVDNMSLRNLAESVQVCIPAQCKRARRALHFARFLTASDQGQQIVAKQFFQPSTDGDVWADVPRLKLLIDQQVRAAAEKRVAEFAAREDVLVDLLPAESYLTAADAGDGPAVDAYFGHEIAWLEGHRPKYLTGMPIAQCDLVLLVRQDNLVLIERLNNLTSSDWSIGLAHPQRSLLGEMTHKLLVDSNLNKNLLATRDATDGPELIADLLAGRLEIAIVFRTDARQNPQLLTEALQIVEIGAHGPSLTHQFAVRSDSVHKSLARRLLRALQSADSQTRFEDIGLKWLNSPRVP